MKTYGEWTTRQGTDFAPPRAVRPRPAQRRAHPTRGSRYRPHSAHGAAPHARRMAARSGDCHVRTFPIRGKKSLNANRNHRSMHRASTSISPEPRKRCFPKASSPPNTRCFSSMTAGGPVKRTSCNQTPPAQIRISAGRIGSLAALHRHDPGRLALPQQQVGTAAQQVGVCGVGGQVENRPAASRRSGPTVASAAATRAAATPASPVGSSVFSTSPSTGVRQR